jgi:hypothetical protein
VVYRRITRGLISYAQEYKEWRHRICTRLVYCRTTPD